MKNMILVVSGILFLNCGGYYTLKPNQTIVHYFDDSQKLVIFKTKDIPEDTIWKSQYCDLDFNFIRIIRLKIGDTVDILEKNNIISDTILIKKNNGKDYMVYRFLGCPPYDKTCVCTYFLPDSLTQYPCRHKYVDLYFDSSVLKSIKYKFIGP